ncbi:COMM domain-containing protein 9-like isoform X2 [Rhopilema esculentum]|uniref:COMM domain-containing protein 9-like isoform X2 n=1 Tax=Rhopilema esculentum TaxID=499914 RepID=UPI0031DF8451
MAPSQDGSDGNVSEKSIKCNFEQLNFLLKAPSKEFVKKLLQDCFAHINSTIPKGFSEKVASDLDVPEEDAIMLIGSVSELIKMAVFEGAAGATEVFSLFPDDFHKNLRELLSKIIADCMPNWRSDTINQQVSLPRLVDFDWRIDVKTGSSGRPAAPSCLLQLKKLVLEKPN